LQCSTLVSTWPSCGPRGLGAGGPGSPWLSGAAGAALLGGEPTRDEPACMPEACFRRDLGRVSKQKWPQRRSGTAIVPFARTPSVPPNPRVSSDCGLRQTVGMLARSSEPGRSETSRTYSSTTLLVDPCASIGSKLPAVCWFLSRLGGSTSGSAQYGASTKNGPPPSAVHV